MKLNPGKSLIEFKIGGRVSISLLQYKFVCISLSLIKIWHLMGYKYKKGVIFN